MHTNWQPWQRYQSYVLVLAILATLLSMVAAISLSDQNESFFSLQKQGTGHRKPKPAPGPPPIMPSFLPMGGRQLLPNYQLVALYGFPDMPALGTLGDQPLDATITRVKQLATEYQPLTTTPVQPTLEIIATTASASPTENGDYSREADPALLLPWIEAAQKANVYVILDLQPGRSDFPTQAKLYESLLRFPNVGLALDPEWRLKPDQVHLTQIGSVSAAEINQTTQWLADLTAQYKLPQKMLLLHQFRLDMITERETLDTTRPELAFVIQMDGSGSQQEKMATWQAILANPPARTLFGWKNFYKQDSAMIDPTQTMQISPTPVYISYQ